jgi:hypothetical protein
MTIAAGAASFVIYGCQDQKSEPTTKSSALAPAHKGGAQLWSDNCMRCHNLRPPTQFSNAEWQIIVHHMRVRANLTGEEQREILSFIQSANAH